jgi:hypothetical protein
MTNSSQEPNDHAEVVVSEQDHLTETEQRRYVAAFLGGTDEAPEWAHAKQHLLTCDACADGALERARDIWASPQLALLEPGEFARRAQAVWARRLREHPGAPMREAAARELGSVESLGKEGLGALIEAAMGDRDDKVRAAAKSALSARRDHEPLAAVARKVLEDPVASFARQG